MERSENNSIHQIPFIEAFPFLLHQFYLPTDEIKMRRTLQYIKQLGSGVTFWHFKFNNFKDDCFDVAYNALLGSEQ